LFTGRTACPPAAGRSCLLVEQLVRLRRAVLVYWSNSLSACGGPFLFTDRTACPPSAGRSCLLVEQLVRLRRAVLHARTIDELPPVQRGLALDPRDKPEDDNCGRLIPFSCVILGIVPRIHISGCSDEFQTKARSAEARPTGRRTKCALAERSRQAAGVSGIKQDTKSGLVPELLVELADQRFQRPRIDLVCQVLHRQGHDTGYAG
jgi:hypothetical protein